MKIRMVPVEQLFRRFPRVVRDVAKLRNKEIDLEISGQNTDLDKSILDALAEPLAHSCAMPPTTALSRPPSASYRKTGARHDSLDAYHEGDQVVIEVSDDGRGLDREKIRRSAPSSEEFSQPKKLRG